MAQLTPGSKTDRLANRFGHGTDPESLRSSESRRQLLERWGRIIAGVDLSLYLNSTYGETAFVKLQGDVPHIEIPSWEIQQVVTSYPRVTFDMLMQRTLTLHEIGHVKYTDQAAVDAVVSQVDPARREQFHDLWNALEDGAIEEQLRREFSVADELETMNANFSQSGSGDVEHDLFDAMIIAALDLAVYDSGRLGSLLNPDDESRTLSDGSDRAILVEEIMPAVKSAVVDIVSEPDPEARADRVFDLWEQVSDLFDPAAQSQIGNGKGDHLDQDNGSGSPAPDLGDIDTEDLESFIDDIASSSNADTDSSAGDSTQRIDSDDQLPDDGSENGGTHSGATDTRNDDTDTGDGKGKDTGQGEDNDTSDPDDGSRRTGVDDEESSNMDANAGPGASIDGTEPEEGSDGRPNVNENEDGGGSDADNQGTSGTKGDNRGQTDGVQADSDADRQFDLADQPPTSETDGDDDSGSDGAPGASSEGEEGGAANRAGANDTGGGSSGETRFARDEDTIGTDQDVADEYERLVDEQRDADEAFIDDLQDELDRLEKSLTELSDEVPNPSLEVPSEHDVRSGAWTTMQEEGRRLRRLLERRLQEEERSKTRRGLRHGRIDPRALTRIHQSDPRVFRSEEKPNSKEYAVVLVLDRSGSMGNDVLAAEKACVSLSIALEELDIDTCILDVCGGNQRLAKPFGVESHDCLPKLVTGETGGSTPLTGALQMARQRLRQRDEFPFVIVVTDGRPDDPESYRSALSECRFPVLGVYLQFGAGTSLLSDVDQSADLFDRRRIVTDKSRLSDELQRLCQEVMF